MGASFLTSLFEIGLAAGCIDLAAFRVAHWLVGRHARAVLAAGTLWRSLCRNQSPGKRSRLPDMMQYRQQLHHGVWMTPDQTHAQIIYLERRCRSLFPQMICRRWFWVCTHHHHLADHVFGAVAEMRGQCLRAQRLQHHARNRYRRKRPS